MFSIDLSDLVVSRSVLFTNCLTDLMKHERIIMLIDIIQVLYFLISREL